MNSIGLSSCVRQASNPNCMAIPHLPDMKGKWIPAIGTSRTTTTTKGISSRTAKRQILGEREPAVETGVVSAEIERGPLVGRENRARELDQLGG